MIFFNDGGKTVDSASSVVGFEGVGVENYYRCKMAVTPTGGLSFRPAISNSECDSKYITFQDKKTNLACADDVKVLASGGFSGCIFQLWEDPNKNIWGAHVYKGLDFKADISSRAKEKKWRLLYSLDTAGKGKSGSEIFVVAVIENNKVDIVSQRIRNGKCEKLIDWYTIQH